MMIRKARFVGAHAVFNVELKRYDKPAEESGPAWNEDLVIPEAISYEFVSGGIKVGVQDPQLNDTVMWRFFPSHTFVEVRVRQVRN
jgi:hypothetical protein